MERMIRKYPNVVTQMITALNKASVSRPSSAWILGDNKECFKIMARFSFSDYNRKQKVTMAYSLIVRIKAIDDVMIDSIIHEVPTSSVAYHPSKQLYATLKTEEVNKEKQYLEIWEDHKRIHSIIVSDAKDHGCIHMISGQPTFQWHGSKLLYLAEPKTKSESVFKTTTKSHDFELTEAMGREFLYAPNWGEQRTDMGHPQVCVLDTETFRVTCQDLSGASIGQAIWGPDCIIFVAYNEEPYRLGIIHCSNRRSALYSYREPSKVIEKICNYSKETHLRSPRFDPNYKYLVFLQNSSGGPHHKCSRLVVIDWQTKVQKDLVDIVENPSDGDFAGIFTIELPERCFTSNSSHLFFSSLCCGQVKVFAVDMKTGAVFNVSKGCRATCMVVLDVHLDKIIVSAESPHMEPCLMLGQIQIVDDKPTVEWCYLDKKGPSIANDIRFWIKDYTPTLINPDFPQLKCQVIILAPHESKNKCPLIVWPHGGPHSSFMAEYNIYAVAFAKLGFVVAMVNYRGSAGFGEDNINSLLGKIGVQDVSDVKDAVELIRSGKLELGVDLNLDNNLTFMFGGSHGGFIATSFCVQYPDYFTACAVRNPVTDVSSMTVKSDIPDWCFTEAGFEFKFDALSIEQHQKMFSLSPMAGVKQVKTPTLFLLGKKDKRVPHHQGLHFYHLLKQQNVDVRLCLYDDCHSLDGVSAKYDGFMQTASWFLSYKYT